MSELLVQGTQEWREARVGLITGSIVGAVLGVSPFLSRKAALRRMVRESMGGMDHYSNVAMDWGKENEPEAVALYAALYADGRAIEETGLWTKGDLGASPDRLVGDDGLLEVKCPYSKRDDRRPKFERPTEKVLPHYWHQVQMQMHVTGRSWCDFLQWTPHDHHVCRIVRDKSWFDDNVDAFVAFMEEFQQMRHQMAQGGPEDRVAASEGWELAAQEYARAAARASEAKAELEAARATLIALAKSHEVKQVEGAGVKLQEIEREGSVDWKALAENVLGAPEREGMAEKFRRPRTQSWRIDVTGDD